MKKYEQNSNLIKQITKALEGSVPIEQHANLLAALRRTQELLGRAAPYIRNKAISEEARLMANILQDFFDDMNSDPRGFYDISNGFDPKVYLRSKGVLK